MSGTVRLDQLAKTIRSKNAGVDRITFDVIFRRHQEFDRVVRSGALTRATVAGLYRIPEERIVDFVVFEPGLAIKFTIARLSPSGSPGDGDIFGAQQYAPLLAIEVPDQVAATVR